MATTTAALSRIRLPARARARVRHLHVPVENLLLFAVALAFYIALANYLVLHLHYMVNDAYARIDNAFDVLFTRDPHLAAIGFVWPPLPSFLMLPIIAFKGVWPALVSQGFAGSIESALFGAGSVVLLNVGLRWAGVVRGMRWIFCLVWLINPMIAIYSVQGMAEAPFVFFALASLLVFMRWCESRRPALLPLLGVVAGLGCLCRNEMFVFTFFIGVGVVVKSIRWRVSWREVETRALMFALPALLMIGLWVISMAVIERDILYWIHAQSGAPQVAGGASPTPGAGLGGVISLNTWAASVDFIAGHSIALFPAVIAAVAMLAVRVFMKKDRVTGLVLLSLALPIAALDVYLLHSGGLSTTLRYQIFVIPYAFMVCVYVLRSLSKRAVMSSLVALAMVGVLGLSNVGTIFTISDPALSQDEAPGVAALITGKTSEQISGNNAMDLGMQLAPRLAAATPDHGLITCDSTTCFPIVLNYPNPHQLVVTSDRDFQAILAQPQAYHVEYFLVSNSGRDELNVTYPGLWADGAGFSSYVADIGGGFRLYRITGLTGRGA